jgi:hypothetical protein
LSTFSNLFRYRLLLERGGIWADADVVCLRPFDFTDDYLLGFERWAEEGPEKVASCVIGVSPGCELMRSCWDVACARDPLELAWGEIGPALLHDQAARLGLLPCVLPSAAFSPLPWYRWADAISAEPAEQLRTQALIGPDSHAVHLFHEMWRLQSADPDATYPAGCLYETLRQTILTPA